MQKWDTKENASVFIMSLALYLTHRSGEVGGLTFDKVRGR
jgi:hypothetical protein